MKRKHSDVMLQYVVTIDILWLKIDWVRFKEYKTYFSIFIKGIAYLYLNGIKYLQKIIKTI